METGVETSSASDEKEAAGPKERSPQSWNKFWSKEKAAADKRNRKFLKQGNAIVKRFIDERGNDLDFAGGTNDSQTGGRPVSLNLFYTNVSTLQSMLFGQVPKIEVSREHADPDDDIARVAAVIYKRMLEADTYAACDDLGVTLRACLQDRLLPGLGMARVFYNVTMGTEESIDPETGEPIELEVMESEECLCRYTHWQDVLWGWCRNWGELPWLGYRSWLDKEDATARFGAEKAELLTYVNQVPGGDEKNDDPYDTDQINNVQKAEVWEFWHKASGKVFWWSTGVDTILDIRDDPLGLAGFFPSPRPLVANATTTLFRPKGDFTMAQDLYNDIDTLQYRIQMITRAVKVVGVYDKNASDSVGRIFTEGTENSLIPVDNWAMFAEKGGLKGVIDWFPVQDVVGVLQTLIQIRDQTIELLYQVTGMSDILRGGNTEQYAAAGTQALKAKFGSIRVQALQDEFARFASDLDQLKAEVISKHFEAESILVQSNAQYLPQADQDKIMPAIELMKSPDVKWRVTIRPESVAMVDYAQLKSERTEFLTALATYLQSSQAMVQAVPGSLPVLLELLKWGMAGFKGADYLEGTMDSAIEQAKNAPPDDGKQKEQDAAQQMEQAKFQMQMQMMQQSHQLEMQKIQAKAQADMQSQQQKASDAQMQEQVQAQAKQAEEAQKHESAMRELLEEFKRDMALIRANSDADLAVEEAQSVFAAGEAEVTHRNRMAEIEAQAAVTATQEDD